jgi:hypothetical protein
MAKPKLTKTTETTRLHELEDQLKDAERRLAEMKQERDDANALVEQVREQIEDDEAQIEEWIAAFDMELGDNGVWKLNGDTLCEAHDKLVEKHNALLKNWNRAVVDFNAVYADRQSPGRPLAATETQCVEVRRLRKRGISLRDIADETSLSLRTIRTIVGRDAGTDRTTIKRLERLDPMRAEVISAKARQRSRDALPGRINKALANLADLKKAAKGLGG